MPYDVIIEPRIYLKFKDVEANSINEAAAKVCREFAGARGDMVISIPGMPQGTHLDYARIDNECDLHEVEVETADGDYVRLSGFGVSSPRARLSSAELGIDYKLIKYAADNIDKMPSDIVREFAGTIARRYGFWHATPSETSGFSAIEAVNIVVDCAKDGNACGLKIFLHHISASGMLDILKKDIQSEEVGPVEGMAIMASGMLDDAEFLYSKNVPWSPYYKYQECIDLLLEYGLAEKKSLSNAIKIIDGKTDKNLGLSAMLQDFLIRLGEKEVESSTTEVSATVSRKRFR